MLDESGHNVAGIYAVGWAARGATGTIGNCRSDAERLVGILLSDVPTLECKVAARRPDLASILAAKKHSPVTFEQWLLLDQAEKANGAAIGRPRLKMRTVAQMLSTIHLLTRSVHDQ